MVQEDITGGKSSENIDPSLNQDSILGIKSGVISFVRDLSVRDSFFVKFFTKLKQQTHKVIVLRNESV